MKLYDYHCPQCDNTFEEIVDRDDDKVFCSCGEHADKLITFLPSCPHNAKVVEDVCKWNNERSKLKGQSIEALNRTGPDHCHASQY